MSKGREGKNRFEGVGGALFMIGLGVLFLSDLDFWPWILLVIGLSSLPESMARDGLWAGAQSAVWLVGLAVLFALDLFWPGILILIGLSTLAGALVRPPMLDKEKRKRGLPPEEFDEEAEPDDAYYEDDEEPHQAKRGV